MSWPRLQRGLTGEADIENTCPCGSETFNRSTQCVQSSETRTENRTDHGVVGCRRGASRDGDGWTQEDFRDTGGGRHHVGQGSVCMAIRVDGLQVQRHYEKTAWSAEKEMARSGRKGSSRQQEGSPAQRSREKRSQARKRVWRFARIVSKQFVLLLYSHTSFFHQ